MGAMPLDDEQLIDAVLRVRVTLPEGSVAADVHKALVAEGNAELTVSQVKKASSKAMKRLAKAPAPAAPGPAFIKAASFQGAKPGYAFKSGPKGLGYYDESQADAPAPDPASKKTAKAAKAAEATMKSAESYMMEQQRKLRLALGEDEMMGAIAVATMDKGEKFIQLVTQKALEATLSPSEALVPRERLAADLATLEWMLLSDKAGSGFTLPDDARESATKQVARLQKVRESAVFQQNDDKSWVSDCFVLPDVEDDKPFVPASGIDYGTAMNASVTSRGSAGTAVDKALSKQGLVDIGGGFDDDID